MTQICPKWKLRRGYMSLSYRKSGVRDTRGPTPGLSLSHCARTPYALARSFYIIFEIIELKWANFWCSRSWFWGVPEISRIITADRYSEYQFRPTVIFTQTRYNDSCSHAQRAPINRPSPWVGHFPGRCRNDVG